MTTCAGTVVDQRALAPSAPTSQQARKLRDVPVAVGLAGVRYKPEQLRPIAFLGGGLLVLFPLTLIKHALVATPPLTFKAIVRIGLAGTFPGFLSYQAYAVMLRELGATKAGVVMYLSPLYAAVTAWWFLGEAPSGTTQSVPP